MKRYVLATTLIMMIVQSILSGENQKIEDTGKHFGQVEAIYCNTQIPAEGQATIAVQFQAMASKGLRAGDLVAVDNIVGVMRFVPATGPGGFVQGSPASEAGRKADETQFTHILTRNIAVMETEVTRARCSLLQRSPAGRTGDVRSASACLISPWLLPNQTFAARPELRMSLSASLVFKAACPAVRWNGDDRVRTPIAAIPAAAGVKARPQKIPKSC